MRTLTCVSIILLLSQICPATIIHVPSEQPTIQAGINAASEGDTVLVADGTYTGIGNRDISFGGKNIVVKSENGPEYVIIDCEGSQFEQHRGFAFLSGEGLASILEGFTIKNGFGPFSHEHYEGGAVLCENSSPTIKNCIFDDNIGDYQGGAITCFWSTPIITNCTFVGNSAQHGGGIYSNSSNPILENCIITYCSQGSAVEGNANLICCDLYGNQGGDWVGAISGQLGVNGNISQDPLFCDTVNSNLHLQIESPCGPYINYDCNLIGALDVGCGNGINLPLAIDIHCEPSSYGYYVTSITPEIIWQYYDTLESSQVAYEIEVGIDENWDVAEMWSTGQVITSDTVAQYNGLTLEDHVTYYLRIRVFDGDSWGSWNFAMFVIHLETIIHVPIDAATIQDGINLAISGDTVIVSDGIYTGYGNRDIDFDGKNIIVISENGAENAIIDCEGSLSEPHRAFKFHNYENLSAVLNGFTIKNGFGPHSHGHYEGGAVLCENSSPTIKNCIFDDNIGDYQGGAITCFWSTPIITNCTFVGNSAQYGGGIYSNSSNPILENCIITYCSQGSAVEGNANLICCDLYGNQGGDWVGYIADQLGANGNISLDPMFCDTAASDYSIDQASPCHPDSSGCGLIGAFGVGCGQEPRSWNVYADGTGDAPTIQAAIDSCIDGDTVLIYPGTFTGIGNHDISINGKEILISGVNGPDSIILDCTGYDCFVLDHSHEDSNTIIENLTISNANSGILCELSTPKLQNLKVEYCINNGISTMITKNANTEELFQDYSLVIKDCVFSFNQGDGINMSGGGWVSSVNVNNCNFENNFGSGLSSSSDNMPLGCVGCNFQYNNIGIDAKYNASLSTIDSCSFVGNECAVFGSVTLLNSSIEGGTIGIHVSNCYQGDGCNINNCTLQGLNGTVIECYYNMSISSSSIINNMGEIFDCSPIEDCGANIDFDSCTIKGNNGGIFIDGHNVNFTMSNCLYESNNDRIEFKPLFFTNGDFAISNSTLTSNLNDAIRVGELENPTASISNSIISGNVGVGISVFEGTAYNTIILCSDFYGNLAGNYNGMPDQTGINGNISADPLFCNPDSGDYTIADASPCAPENNSCNELIGLYGVGCSAIPSIANVAVGPDEDKQHVLNHVPDIFWSYLSPFDLPQDQYEVAVGNDDDWTYAEMWNPAPFSGEDTSVTYNGSQLLDGETYYLRARVNNGYAWSEWGETSFRMNSIPSIPIPINPQDSSFTDLVPILYLANSIDPELDSLCYAFQIWADTELLITESPWVSEQQDSTSWQSDVDLIENRQHWWRARSSDYYEESEWSEMVMFYANSVNTSPTEFSLITPPENDTMPIGDLLPTFVWTKSSDPDPLDSLYYTLITALDSGFQYTNQVTGLIDSQYSATTELLTGEQYWWKVKAEDKNDGLTWSSNILSFWTMICGDANNDKDVNVSDAVYIINYVFIGGDPPLPMAAGDVNCDGTCNVSDAVFIINYVFVGGNEPCDIDGDGQPDC